MSESCKLPKFIELAVTKSPELSMLPHFVDITLNANIDPKKLPYADIFTPEALSKQGCSRLNTCRIVARGDARSLDEISYFGGFHPSGAVTATYKEDSSYILDVISHRISPDGSGFVSFTTAIDVAKRYCTSSPGPVIAARAQSKNIGFVYFAKGTGLISPSSQICPQEFEYSAPGGIDAEDIVAYRQVNVRKICFDKSSIFINPDFIKKYPNKVAFMINSFLMKDECLKAPELVDPLIDDLCKEPIPSVVPLNLFQPKPAGTTEERKEKFKQELKNPPSPKA